MPASDRRPSPRARGVIARRAFAALATVLVLTALPGSAGTARAAETGSVEERIRPLAQVRLAGMPETAPVTLAVAQMADEAEAVSQPAPQPGRGD